MPTTKPALAGDLAPFGGEVIAPGDAGYDRLRAVWTFDARTKRHPPATGTKIKVAMTYGCPLVADMAAAD
jgi:hypothetical protein